jgi:hypothetical protein
VGFCTVGVTNTFGGGVESDLAVIELGPVAGVPSQDKPEDIVHWGLDGRGVGLMSMSGGPSIQVAAGTIDHQILNNYVGTTASRENHCGVICNATRWLEVEPETVAMPTATQFYRLRKP